MLKLESRIRFLFISQDVHRFASSIAHVRQLTLQGIHDSFPLSIKFSLHGQEPEPKLLEESSLFVLIVLQAVQADYDPVHVLQVLLQG